MEIPHSSQFLLINTVNSLNKLMIYDNVNKAVTISQFITLNKVIPFNYTRFANRLNRLVEKSRLSRDWTSDTMVTIAAAKQCPDRLKSL